MIGYVHIYVRGESLARTITIQDYDKSYVVRRCRENAAKATRVGLFWRKNRTVEEYYPVHMITHVAIEYKEEA